MWMALFLCLAAVWLEVVALNGDFGGTWFQLILWYLPLRNSIFPFVYCLVKEQAVNSNVWTQEWAPLCRNVSPQNWALWINTNNAWWHLQVYKPSSISSSLWSASYICFMRCWEVLRYIFLNTCHLNRYFHLSFLIGNPEDVYNNMDGSTFHMMWCNVIIAYPNISVADTQQAILNLKSVRHNLQLLSCKSLF